MGDFSVSAVAVGDPMALSGTLTLTPTKKRVNQMQAERKRNCIVNLKNSWTMT